MNLSVLDGWWAEGHHGNNGWAIEGISWFDGAEVRHDPRCLTRACIPISRLRTHPQLLERDQPM